MKLIQGDCLEVMATLPDNSVDLTVTSPPYDNLRTYNDMPEWGDHVWKPVIDDLCRLTKQGGVVVWIVSDATTKGSETGTSFKQALHAMDCGFNLHDTMIWTKTGGGAIGSNNCYTQNFEYMFIWSNGKPKAINIIKDIRNTKKSVAKTISGRRRKDGVIKQEKRKEQAEYYRRNNHWQVNNTDRSQHPAIFPESLARDHVISWSNPGDLVLDPFLGSGTTGVACVKTDRDFIGIERDAEYFAIAEKRIQETIDAGIQQELL